MKSRRFSEALGELDDKYIDEAIAYKKSKKLSTSGKWLAAAACLCIAAVAAIVWASSASRDTPIAPDERISETEDGITIADPEISLSADVEYDMLGFFIYNGHLYLQYEWLEDDGSLVGEKLGTATGLINEWTPADGYVELAGSVSGDFYSVNGFDPSFMLCMRFDYGTELSTYVCTTGITLKHGSDLFEDKLHLSDNLAFAEFETRDSWNYSRGDIQRLGEENTELLSDFIAQLNAASFMLSEDIPLDEGQSNIYDGLEIYHLYLRLNNGVTVELRLLEGGYVLFQGLLDLCVQLPESEFSALISAFEAV